MPIVDGLTSTKMIRSFEKSHPTHLLSTRASLNGRVPIIAVSASLVEKERQNYIDAGFDGWILKPIAFNRLTDIMNGIVDFDVRRNNLYKSGNWESGGWFHETQKDVFAADTRPSEEAPIRGPEGDPSSKEVQAAVDTDDPFIKEDNDSRQTQEQQRLAEQQSEQAPKASSMPELGRKRAEGEQGHFTSEERVSSPRPITPEPK
jgi:CheY-like chemotaxis protein